MDFFSGITSVNTKYDGKIKSRLKWIFERDQSRISDTKAIAGIACVLSSVGFNIVII